jgi:hypothetical protein
MGPHDSTCQVSKPEPLEYEGRVKSQCDVWCILWGYVTQFYFLYMQQILQLRNLFLQARELCSSEDIDT